jgi:hypothetical protein
VDAFLDSILRGLITYRIGIYILLGLGILIYLRKFFNGLSEWKRSVFGLERNLAQRKLVSASTGLALLILLMIGEFLLVIIIGPQIPNQTNEVSRGLDPFATATATMQNDFDEAEAMPPTPTIGVDSLTSECVEGVLEITSPEDGSSVSGTVEIIGSVNVEDFGSYKYEYSSAGAVNWVTIAAGNQLRLDENLGFWYTSELPPGAYLVQLVPLNNAGEELQPCIIRVDVIPEE